MLVCPPIRHPRGIGDPVQQVKKKTGFPISLRRFGNDAFRDEGVLTNSSSPRNRGTSATSEAEDWIPNIAQTIWE